MAIVTSHSTHPGQLRLTLLLCLVALQPIFAVELTPGVQYSGGQRVQDPESGTSLEVPAGWIGVLPQGEETFVLASQTSTARVLVSGDEMTVDEVLSTMGTPIPIGNILLTPTGQPQVAGNTIFASYSVSGAQDPLAAEARTVVAPSGIGVAVVGISTPQEQAMTRELVARVAASIQFEAPATTYGAGAPAGTGGASNPWRDNLAGQKLQRFFSGSNYSESSSIWLCANGAFYRDVQAGGYGGGASGAVQGKSEGQWSASGGDEQGSLELAFADGRRWTYTLTYSETSDGSLRLFLDGDRWFRESVDCQ